MLKAEAPLSGDTESQELLAKAISDEYAVVGISSNVDPIVDFEESVGIDCNPGQQTQYRTIHSGSNDSHIVLTTPDRVTGND